jgi:hypothetical protein
VSGAYSQVFVASVVVVALSVAGCSSNPSQGVSTSASAAESSVGAAKKQSTACAESSAPMLSLKPHTVDEPTLAIPQPQGWERSTDLDSALIRGVIANVGLRADDFTPNAVATLEDTTGKVQTAQQAVDAEVAGVEQSGIAMESQTPGTICGQSSKTVNYTLQNRPVTALIVAAEHEQKIWAAVLTVQTSAPENPTYIADKQTILSGFRLSWPGTG